MYEKKIGAQMTAHFFSLPHAFYTLSKIHVSITLVKFYCSTSCKRTFRNCHYHKVSFHLTVKNMKMTNSKLEIIIIIIIITTTKVKVPL